jgi:hypothetical protein
VTSGAGSATTFGLGSGVGIGAGEAEMRAQNSKLSKADEIDDILAIWKEKD